MIHYNNILHTNLRSIRSHFLPYPSHHRDWPPLENCQQELYLLAFLYWPFLGCRDSLSFIKFIPPGKNPTIGSSGGFFPLRLGRQSRSPPLAVGLGMEPVDMDNWVVCIFWFPIVFLLRIRRNLVRRIADSILHTYLVIGSGDLEFIDIKIV